MSWFLISLIVVACNALYTLVDSLALGAINGFFYGLLGLSSTPGVLPRFVISGVVHLVISAILLIVIRVEIYIASRDKTHVLYMFLQFVKKYIGNDGEGWPSPLLSIATILHGLNLILVFDNSLPPNLWWGFAVFLMGLWGNFLFGERTGRQKEKERTKTEDDDSQDKDNGAKLKDLMGIIRSQKWFHNQVVFQYPWPGEIPITTDLPLDKLEERYGERENSYGGGESQEKLLSNPVVSTLVKNLLSHSVDDQERKSRVDSQGLFSHQINVLELLDKKQTEKEKPMHVLMATPLGSGRTTVGLIAALKKAVEDKANVLLIYPDPIYGRALVNHFVNLINESGWEWAITLASCWSDQKGVHWFGEGQVNDDSVMQPDLMFTDIEALHNLLLPEHKERTLFFEQLGLIIVENAEEFNGVFGANVSFVLRRLLRIVKMNCASPQILATTARLEGLESFFELIFALDPDEFAQHQIIEEDGRGRKNKEIVFWNPQFDHLAHHKETGETLQRANYYEQARKILALLVKEDYHPVLLQKGVAVCGSDVAATNQEVLSQLQSKERREINIPTGETIEIAYSGEFDVEYRDSDDFDVAVVAGVPGTWASLMHDLEHLGNSSEREKPIIIVLLPDTPLAQYVGRNAPEYMASYRNTAETIIPFSNPSLIKGHLLAALQEIPASEKEIGYWFGENGRRIFESLAASGEIEEVNELLLDENGGLEMRTLYTIPKDTELPRWQLNGFIGDDLWELLVDTRSVGVFTSEIVERTAYKGAILMHQGQRFQVIDVDDTRKALIAERIGQPLTTERIIDVEFDYNSVEIPAVQDPKDYTIDQKRLRPGAPKIPVHSVVWGTVYEKITAYDTYHSYTYDHDSGTEGLDFDRPPFVTRIFQLRIPGASVEVCNTLANLIRAVLPLFIRDVLDKFEVVVSDKKELMNGSPVLLAYDSMRGGTGVANWLAKGNNLERVLMKAYDFLVSCPCESGCRGCIEIPDAHATKKPLDKIGTLQVLSELLMVEADSVIAHRTGEITSTSVVSKMAQNLVDYVFPHKMDMHIQNPADPTVIQDGSMTDGVRGMYFSGENEVHLMPMNEEDMLAVLAHEYAHNWQWKGKQPMSSLLMDEKEVPYFNGKLFIEGFAQWVEFKIAEHYGFRKVMDQVRFRHFDEYTEGFKAIKWIEKKYGAGKVMEFVRTGKLTENDKIITPNGLLELSEAKSDLRKKEHEFSKSPPPDDIIHNIVIAGKK